MARELVINFDNGVASFVWDDSLAFLTDHGDTTITRASHVEPDGAGWRADMAPVGGPVLGPFRLRQEALDAERDFLAERFDL